MVAKPTYEELELRIDELERKAFGSKLPKEALQTSKGFLDTLVSSVSDGIIVYDDKFRYKFWNKFMEKLTGMRAENVLGKIAFDLFPHLREEGIDKLLERALTGETVQSDDTNYYIPDTGKVGWVTGIYSPYVDPSGNIVGVVAIVHDISDRKRGEEALRASEEKYRNIFENIQDVYYEITLDGKILEVSPSIEDISLYKREEIIGKLFSDIYVDPKKRDELLKELLKNGKVADHEIVLKDKDDSQKYCSITAKLLFDKHGNPIKIIGSGRNIEDRKQAEKKLRKSEEKYRLLVENQTDMIVTFDTESHLLFVSPSYLETFDKTEDELIGKKFMPLIHEEDRETVAKAIANAHKPPYNAYVEERVMTKDGWRWQAWLNTAMLNEQGKVESIVAIGRDITEQKQAEEKLRKSEEKYRLLVESTPNWVWMCDLKSRITFSNNSVKEILGYEIHEILGKTALSLIHTEDRKSVQKWFQNAKKQKRGWRGSIISWQHKDKTIRFLETIAEPIFDDKGNLIGYSGIDRDVTPRILSEIELQKAHYELQEKTIKLEVKKKSLEELNTAMKVLLKKREEDKTEIEKNVMTNVKELIEPYFEKIKKTKLDDQQRALLSIMKSNINEIVSPFTRKMSLKYLNLTPTEIRIANLIRHGSTTKEIAEILHVSPKTVETHRKNIRRKIGLEGKRANLRSHLLSFH